MNHLDCLPLFPVREIFGYLDLRDFTNLGACNGKLYKIMKSDPRWISFLQAHFPMQYDQLYKDLPLTNIYNVYIFEVSNLKLSEQCKSVDRGAKDMLALGSEFLNFFSIITRPIKLLSEFYQNQVEENKNREEISKKFAKVVYDITIDIESTRTNIDEIFNSES